MNRRGFPVALLLAILGSIAGAQGTTVVDSQRKVIDTTGIHLPNAPTDTLLPPLARAEMVYPLRADSDLHWDRAKLNAMDVLTLQDLLAYVPTATTLTAGWIAAPSTAACWGHIPCVRVFQDGIEMDELDPRASGVLDLSQFLLWAAEEISIEQTGDEIRVYIRTWRVDRWTPFTQTDIATGDENTNLYRFFFGQGFHNGMRVQLAAQQYGTTPQTYLGTSSDETSFLGRVGWAGANGLRIDGFFSAAIRHRGSFTAINPLGAPTGDSIPTLDASRRLDYVRVGLGDPDTSRRWIQLVASQTGYSFTGEPAAPTAVAPTDTVSSDTLVTRVQYVATAGLNGLGAHLSVTDRVRKGAGPTISTPSVRASYDKGPLQLSGFVEGRGPDSLTRRGAAAEFDPLRWIRVTGSVQLTQGPHNGDTTFSLDTTTLLPDTALSTGSTLSSQLQVGVRVRDLWFSGGVLHRDSVTNGVPSVYGTLSESRLVASTGGPATGAIASIQGRLAGPFYLNASGLRWNDTLALYQPQYQARAELMLKGNLLHRFPTNDFGFQGSLIYVYRSQTLFPTADSTIAATGYRTLSSEVEVRILSAVITWRFTNIIGEKYFQIPGYLMPRISNFYGVRWVFWN